MFKLFPKRKEKSELRFNDVKEFIEINTEKEFFNIEKRVKGVVDDVMKDVSKLKEQLKELKEINSDDNFSNNIKNKYCERCLAIFNLEIPKISYSQLNKFIGDAENIKKSVDNLTFKEFKHMRHFKTKMGRISLQTKIIGKKIENLRNITKGSVLEKKEKIEKCMDWIDEINKKISSVNNEINNIQTKKEELEKEISKLKSELNGFEKDGTQEKFDDKLKETESLERQMNMIKQNIDTEFGGILRPLKKLQYASDSGEVALLKEEKNMLEQYLHSSNAFFSDKNILIRNLINQVKDLSSKNIIELNEKEREKVFGIYGNLNFLISLKMQYNKLMEPIREREEKIKNVYLPFAERKKSAKFGIELKRDEIERLNNDIKIKNEEIEKLRKKIASNVSALEDMINDFLNVEAKIIY
jgi:uncharacterized protein YukE